VATTLQGSEGAALVDSASARRLALYAARSRCYAWVATAFVFVVCCLVWIGWEWGIERLKRVFPNLIEMNPVTALLFALCALSLVTQQLDRRWVRIAGRFIAGVVVLIGLIKLQRFFSGVETGIDEIFFTSKLNLNRMAPNTAMNFVLIGSGLLTLHASTRRMWRPSQVLALLAGATSMLALLGYAYGAKRLYLIGAFVPMALHTAVCFILLASAMLAAFPQSGVMRRVLSDSFAGAMLRRLLPAALLVPSLLGSFRMAGLTLHWFDAELGVAILVVLTMAAFGVLAWINSRVLERTDQLRHQAEVALSQERNLLRSLIDNLPDHIYIKDAAGRYVTDNASHAQFVGMSKPGDVVGKTVADFFPPELAAKYTADDNAVVASGEPLIAREEPIVSSTGEKSWIATTKVPIRDGNGAVNGLVCVSRDITRRKVVEQEMLELQNFLFSIIENIPNMVFVKDAEHLRFVRFNQAGEQLLGYPREELIGKNDYDLFPKDEADFFIAKDRTVLNQRKLVDIPAEPIMTRQGERILHTKKIPILIDGVPRYLLGISEDITDRVQAEQQLRE
jgi:PAS domain S-box-containing protein